MSDDIQFLENYIKTGKLENDSVYYFDPPLEEDEMRQLQGFFHNLPESEYFIFPLIHTQDGEDKRLLWIHTDSRGKIMGWQNPSIGNYDDENDLQTRQDVLDWFQSSIEDGYSSPQNYYINGRIFLSELSDTESMFDSLTESERRVSPLESDSVYYFDPPLDGYEMNTLEGILNGLGVIDSHLVTAPLRRNEPDEHGLLWINTNYHGNTIRGFQNARGKDRFGSSLMNYTDTIRWYKSSVARGFNSPPRDFIDGRKSLMPNIDTESMFDSLNENHIENFLTTNKLEPRSVYYFNPPLEEDEMKSLYGLFEKIPNRELVTNPLKNCYQEDNDRGRCKLVFFETNSEGEISAYQNIDEAEDADGELYLIKDLDSTIKFYEITGEEANFINGRDFLQFNGTNTDDAFNQLYENKLNEIGSKRAKDTHVIYRDPNMVVIVPLSFESAKSFSRGTRYCTGGDCGHGSPKSGKDMFNSHIGRGDILYRLIFKDGTKVRLTWNGDINDKEFHWGLGRKDSYPAFTSRNMDNPFDLDHISETRTRQLDLKRKIEPREKRFDKWAKNFFKTYDANTFTEMFQKIREKYEFPTHLNGKGPLSLENRLKMEEEEERVYQTYSNMKREIMGDVSNISYWWDDGHEELYNAIKKIPHEAVVKMIEYISSGKYKPRKVKMNESTTGDPIIGKMIIFDSSNDEEDIRLLLNFFKIHGYPTKKRMEWTDADIEIVNHDFLRIGKELGIGIELDYEDRPEEGYTIYWGDPEHHSMEEIPFNDYKGYMNMDFDTNSAFDSLNESEGEDEFQWVSDLTPKNITHDILKNEVDYKLQPLRIQDLRTGMFIKRRTGQFLYEIGPEVNRTFRDAHTKYQYNDQPGFILKNLSNGREYYSMKTQIVREFFLIVPKN